MDSFQREEVKIRIDVLEILAQAYRHLGLLRKIRKVKSARNYKTAISSIHEIEGEMKKKKHESFRKKLRKKFGGTKAIKRRKR